VNDISWTGEHANEWAQRYGGQAIDLDKPTYFEVSIERYPDELYAVNAGCYSVDVDRGPGRCTVYQTDSKDKALGVAEYLEGAGRNDRGPDGEDKPSGAEGQLRERMTAWRAALETGDVSGLNDILPPNEDCPIHADASLAAPAGLRRPRARPVGVRQPRRLLRQAAFLVSPRGRPP
jgi:hypothetical protein